MSRKESKAVPEGEDPIPQYVMPGRVTLEDFRRVMLKVWDRKLHKLTEDLRRTDQRLASIEADGPADEETRERSEGAAKAVQAIHGDRCSANRVDPDPMCSTSFGVKVEPPALPCRDDVLVENGAAAPKSGLSPLEMHSTAAAGGLLPAGMATSATKTAFHQLSSA